jgi:hypothetical protein
MLSVRYCVVAVLLSFLCAGVIRADTLTLTAVDMGWYQHNASESGYHDPAKLNYLAARLFPSASPMSDYRNFFVFDLSGVTGTVAGARLELNTLQVSGNETYELYHVATPVATLLAGGSGKGSIFDDLGDGTVYATQSILASQPNTTIDIALNSGFVSNANAAIGGRFAIGGALTSLASTGNQYVFGYQSLDGPPLSYSRLVLTVVPEPGMLTLLLAGAIGLFVNASRRRLRRP